MASYPAGGPSGLEVVATRYSIHVKHLARHEEHRDPFGLHSSKVDLNSMFTDTSIRQNNFTSFKETPPQVTNSSR